MSQVISKIRKINSTLANPALVPLHGPQAAAIYVDAGTNELIITIDEGREIRVPLHGSTELNVKQFGAIGNGIADDTAAIQAAFDAAIESGGSVFIPAGTYKTTAELVWADPTPRIRGVGYRSRIRPNAHTFNALTVGTGSGGIVVAGAGYVRDLNIARFPEVLSPSGTTCGLKVHGANWTEVRNVTTQFFPIGFDLDGVSFGTAFYNCCNIGPECRYGIVLRGFGVSGSDIPFYNCRFNGGHAGVIVEGSNGGYHFHGCVLGGGTTLPAPDDNVGVMTTGVLFDDFIAGNYTSVGSCYITCVGVTFERPSNNWCIRHHGAGTDPGGLNLHITGGGFFGSTTGAGGAIGVMKITGGYNDRVIFDMTGPADGIFSSANPVVYAGAGGNSRPYLCERGAGGKTATFAGVALNCYENGMLYWSKVARAHVSTALKETFNGKSIRFDDDGTMDITQNFGTDAYPTRISTVANV